MKNIVSQFFAERVTIAWAEFVRLGMTMTFRRTQASSKILP